jgi:hypothetical protein
VFNLDRRFQEVLWLYCRKSRDRSGSGKSILGNKHPSVVKSDRKLVGGGGSVRYHVAEVDGISYVFGC